MDEIMAKAEQILAEKETYLIPSNIKAGVTIFGITGTYTGDEPQPTIVWSDEYDYTVAYGDDDDTIVNALVSYSNTGLVRIKFEPSDEFSSEEICRISVNETNINWHQSIDLDDEPNTDSDVGATWVATYYTNEVEDVSDMTEEYVTSTFHFSWEAISTDI